MTTTQRIEKELKAWLGGRSRGGPWWEIARAGITDRALMLKILELKGETSTHQTPSLNITTLLSFTITLRETGMVIAKNDAAVATVRRVLKLPYPKRGKG